jgi:predicted MPP superfamily phosphohydrolase
MRLLIAVPLLLLFLWAQRYWFLRFWRFGTAIKSLQLRRLVLALIASVFGLMLIPLLAVFFSGRRDLVWRFAGLMGVVGFWITTAFFSWLVLRLFAAGQWIWRRVHHFPASPAAPNPNAVSPSGEATAKSAATDPAVRLDRRHFVQAASVLAGAAPFGVGAYGFLIGRHNYRVYELSLPIDAWPRELDGLRIAQLSDIHIGSYMSRAEVRRVVGMVNELKPDLSVVTGDFLTGAHDPLEACIAELAALRAPLGVWGCNGNHEIYAKAEETSAELFASHGMRLLRQENAEIAWRGAKFNLIGVDYQLARDRKGLPLLMLAQTASLMRGSMPNILLSHNPNSFPRAAELGINLMLTGHTHGGQVRVEILDRNFSPAEFLTSYVAGLYKRPLGVPASLTDEEAWQNSPRRSGAASLVYVNRGLGTIGAPIRLGVPPEISLLTLRCA